jgi:hypothetical protein
LLQARYGADSSFGADKNSGGLRLQRLFGESDYIAASMQAFQTSYEFRVDRGTVLGFGGDGRVSFGSRTWLRGGIMVFSHENGAQSAETDWSQVRAYLTFGWSLGTEAGATGRGGLR